MSAPLRRKKRKLVIARGALFAGEGAAAPIKAPTKSERNAQLANGAIALAAALGLHALLGAIVLIQQRTAPIPPIPRAPHREIAASIVRRDPPAEPPKPPPPRPPAHIAARAPQHVPAPPPPPAQAGRAIALEGPADMTWFDLVVGQGSSYAGGTSSAKGTNTSAVHEQAQLGNSPRKLAVRAADLSRAPAPLRRDWACAWPEEAQDSELRDARVTLRVHVSREGEPAQIDVIAAPPGGFSEAARRCAESERYRAALDSTGAPVAAATPLFNVHFLR